MGQIDVGTQEWLSSRRPIEGRYRSLQAYRAFDEISQKSFIDFKVTFVFGQVAPVVALCENPPNDCVQTQSMWDRLKDHISILRAIIMPTQCSQRKCVGGVVREIESALEGKILITRISKALAAQPSNSARIPGSALSCPILARFSSSCLLMRGDRLPSRK